MFFFVMFPNQTVCEVMKGNFVDDLTKIWNFGACEAPGSWIQFTAKELPCRVVLLQYVKKINSLDSNSDDLGAYDSICWKLLLILFICILSQPSVNQKNWIREPRSWWLLKDLSRIPKTWACINVCIWWRLFDTKLINYLVSGRIVENLYAILELLMM